MTTASPEYREGDPIPGTQYRFVREIGAGGHGCVYLVEHTFLESQAVMKLLHGDLVAHGDLAARMTREARTLAKLRHPNVVEVRDGGLTGEPVPRPYFVMEQLNGMALRDMLRKTRGGLGVLPALRIVTDILIGLDHAHNAGVVHRDIKPDNVYLHRTSSAVTSAKILDFGIAHLLLGQRLTGRYFLGTPRYAAPEQLRGETPTARTDIYAAGLVLHELVTGEQPFSTIKDIGALLNAHLNESLPKPSRSNPDVPPTLDKFLETMLAKNPDDRPPTAFAAAVGLREIRGRLEAEMSSSMHSPEFKTEPSPMEDVLYAASPDDPPIVTEVALPLGINDTTPDDVPRIEALRASVRAAADPSTTVPAPAGRRAPHAAPVRTVPLAAAVVAKPAVDRSARTNTAKEHAVLPRRGENDTSPMSDRDVRSAHTKPMEIRPARAAEPVGLAEKGATTSRPIVVARADDGRAAGAANAESRERARGARRRAFAMKVGATVLVLGGGALSVTTWLMRGPSEQRAVATSARASAEAPGALGDSGSTSSPSISTTAPPSPASARMTALADPVLAVPNTAPSAPVSGSPSAPSARAAAPRPPGTAGPTAKRPPPAAPPPSAVPFD